MSPQDAIEIPEENQESACLPQVAHAPGAPVAVTVTGGGHSSLLAEIISGRPAAGIQGAPSSGAGAGLIGLAERLALVGGTLEHGTNTAGEFILRAAIPVQS